MTTKALKAIQQERDRQIAKGHTLDDDLASNKPGDCALGAAAMLAQAGTMMRDPTAVAGATAPTLWPWTDGWNPGTTEEELVKAGALIVAELERLYVDQK